MISPLSPEREAEIRARAEAATPPAWDFFDEESGSLVVHTEPHGDTVCVVDSRAYNTHASTDGVADAEFIAHSRADVPDLLAEIDRLREELAMAGGTGAALDHERAENQRLRDVIDSQARLLSRVGSRRAALAAPTPEETP